MHLGTCFVYVSLCLIALNTKRSLFARASLLHAAAFILYVCVCVQVHFLFRLLDSFVSVCVCVCFPAFRFVVGFSLKLYRFSFVIAYIAKFQSLIQTHRTINNYAQIIVGKGEG